MATTQSFAFTGHAPPQQQPMSLPQDDQQELFLRSLFSTPAQASPSGSSGSHSQTTSPTAILSESAPSISSGSGSGSSNSGLSPISSASFQNIQDFVFGSPGNMGDVNGKELPDVHTGGASLSAAQGLSLPFAPPSLGAIDQQAFEYFFNSMNGFDRAQGISVFDPAMQHQIQAPRHMMAQPVQYPDRSGAPQGSFTFAGPPMHAPMHAPSFGAQLAGSGQYGGPMQTFGGGKRPAPVPEAPVDWNASAHKRSKSGHREFEQAPAMGPAIPHMAVGSNATALAAIERLKATKRAAALRQEEQLQAGAKGSVKVESTMAPAPRQAKKVAHNAIERRYRNNINARIAALRHAVPALRELRPKRPTRKGKEAIPEDLVDGVPAATKLNKATILGKATDYIRYLKGREVRLSSEVAGLRELIRSLEGGEELLDLWQDEMERVHKVQEQADESADLYDDEEEEEDDEEDVDSKESPLRYMMGVAMGFTVLGSTGSDEHFGGHPAGRVIGASRQLLKRSITAANGKVQFDPHHLDHAPSHHLLIEVLRGAIIIGCLLFLFWPAIAKILPGLDKGKQKHRRSSRNIDLSKLTALKASATPVDQDVTLRHALQAPKNAISSALSLFVVAITDTASRLRLLAVPAVEDDEATCWFQLLELETSLGPLVQRSLLARLHTIVRVITMQRAEKSTVHPSRIYATVALAIVRSTSGNALAMAFADRYWTMARRARLLISHDEDSMDVKDVRDAFASERWVDAVLALSLSQAANFLPSPTSAGGYCTPPYNAATRTRVTSPLASIAASQSMQSLTDLWAELLCQVAKSTVVDEGATALGAFAQNVKERSLSLACIRNAGDRDSLSLRIARLAHATPPCEDVRILTSVLFGTWALLLGNVGTARSIATVLVSQRAHHLSSASVLISLVLPTEAAALQPIARATSTDDSLAEGDALASATLSWLAFMRLFADTTTQISRIPTASISIRRQLALARTARVSPSSSISEAVSRALPASALLSRGSISSTESSVSWTPSEGESAGISSFFSLARCLDDAIDALTDVLTILGRRSALCDPKTTSPVASLLLASSDIDEIDSGIECAEY